MHQATPVAGAAFRGSHPLIEALTEDRVLAVVRARLVPDVLGLCAALRDGGIRVVELTFTIPDLPRLLAEATASDSLVGAGTVLTAADARLAVNAGAQFLVTPGLGPDSAEIVRIGHGHGIPVTLGALTPSEVLAATRHDADLVKIFPARMLGPAHLSDLRGPFPDVRLLPSGGITVDNARDFLDAGALAVSAGAGVVSPASAEAGDWADVTERARALCARLSTTP